MGAKECPFCHQSVDNAEAIFCPKCGQDLGISRHKPGEPPPEPPAPKVLEPEPEIVEPPPSSADAEAWVKEVFAPAAQPVVTQPFFPQPVATRRGLSPKWIALIVAAALVVIAAVVIAIVLGTREHDGGTAASTTTSPTTTLAATTTSPTTTLAPTTTSTPTTLAPTTTEAGISDAAAFAACEGTLLTYLDSITAHDYTTAYAQLSADTQDRVAYGQFESVFNTTEFKDIVTNTTARVDDSTVVLAATWKNRDTARQPDWQTNSGDWEFQLVEDHWVISHSPF